MYFNNRLSKPSPLSDEEKKSMYKQMFGEDAPNEFLSNKNIRPEDVFNKTDVYLNYLKDDKSKTISENNRPKIEQDLKKQRKTPIPKAVKNAVWIKYVGEDIGKTKCFSCNIKEISQLSFHCGHVISEASGGKVHVDNLRPICSTCNHSMGTTNMDTFRNTHF